VRIFGIDPGSLRTGYGCVQTDGTRHRLVMCGALSAPQSSAFPNRLRVIHDGILGLLLSASPDCVVIENLFYARNVRSALTLGHARGVVVLAAVQAGLPVVEYTPAEIKKAVVGYGRAEKSQIQQMVKLLLGLDTAPSPHDAADALAVALCHAHSACAASPDRPGSGRSAARASGGDADLATAPSRVPRHERSWRHAKLEQLGRRRTP
jgi:crossover junction endodeoxyribonuclease RuvC